MKVLQSLLVAAAAAVCTLSLPSSDLTGVEFESASKRAGIPEVDGACTLASSGFWYCLWSDTQSTPNITIGPGPGTIKIIWSGNGNIGGGIGWNPGYNGRVINYNGTYNPNGNGYLAVYGWTRSPLIEYYIVESYGSYNPSSAAARKGTVRCDGANYDILQTTRVNQPSIDGIQTFQQFWSVRNPKKNPGGSISGTVSTGCHFNAWRQYGMNLGSNFNYQIVAMEGYFSSGSAQITVSSNV